MSRQWGIATETDDLGCAECYQQLKGGGPSLASGETVQVQQRAVLWCGKELFQRGSSQQTI